MKLLEKIKQSMDITKDILSQKLTGGTLTNTIHSQAISSTIKGVVDQVDRQDVISFAQGSILAFLVFLLYLELNPKIGGIMFRPWSDGKTYFNPFGVIPVLKYPFQNLHFWKPENWDLNFVMVSALGGGLFVALRKSFELIR